MTSVSPPPAWISVFNLSKYSCDSRAIARYATWNLPLYCSLNLSISLGLLPARSGKVKTTLPEPPPPRPQPEAPSTVTPATPMPLSFKKSRRLNMFLREVTLVPARVCSPDIFLLIPTAASYHRHAHARMVAYSCATSIPRGVARASPEAGSIGESNRLLSMGCGNEGTATLLGS
jgi:hypothetical protein